MKMLMPVGDGDWRHAQLEAVSLRGQVWVGANLGPPPLTPTPGQTTPGSSESALRINESFAQPLR